MEKVNLIEKLSKFTELWRPKIVGELNGQYVKLAKLKGEFTWHHHEGEEDEVPYSRDFYGQGIKLIVEIVADKNHERNV